MQDTYIKKFGFSEAPFNLIAEPRFFYTNPAYQEAFLALRYGIKLRKGVTLLTGESGSGKTSVMTMVKARSESNIRIAEIASSAQDSSALLERITRGLGLKKIPADRQALLGELRGYLIQQLELGYIVAVLVDDAQELDLDSLEELDSVAELHSDDKSLLQIVLIGRPELETKLADPALRTLTRRIAVRLQVAPLKSDEVGAYIDHRTSRAGNSRAGLFQPAGVAKIAAYSRGIPGLINVISDRALRSACAGSQRDVNAQTIDQVWQNLQLTGECEFEVAALLADIRQNSQTAGEHLQAENSSAKARAGATQKKSLPHWPEARSIGSRAKLHRKRGSALGAVAMSIPLAALFLAGAAAFLLNGPRVTSSVKNFAVAVTERQTNSEANGRVFEQVLEAQVVAQNPSSIDPVSSLKPLIEPKNRPNVPIVYVHTSEERDRAVLEEMVKALRHGGFAVREPRFTGARTQGDVRFFFLQDRADAERIKSLVQSELGKRGYSLSLQLLQRDGKKFEHAGPGKIEVWFPPLAGAGRLG